MAKRVPKISADGPITIEVLEACLDRLADIMAEAPQGGEVYLPIWERLEREIEAKKASESTMARARVLAERSVDQTATAEDDAKPPKNHVPLKDRLALSPEEASALSGIGVTSIKQATYRGALVARKHGRNTVILPEDLKAFLIALPLIDKSTA
ncbi:helix-turn-helix domain-containing protein [Bradyrhizobium sp.]|uniref:helix-turn-helix domain-containing protein n=1 Tax=Bradyrhizobium sp. TaxID=376 RepID=UPI0039E4F672